MNEHHTTPELNWRAVRRTLEMILPLADTFAFMFYQRFFELQPETRPLFQSDMSAQRRKVIGMLTFALRDLDQPKTIADELYRLGRLHAPYQISRRQYERMNDAIIWTLAELLGENFNEEMRGAWHHALANITNIMLAAAAEVEKETAAAGD